MSIRGNIDFAMEQGSGVLHCVPGIYFVDSLSEPKTSGMIY